jgi:hypothetical protein
MMSNLKILHETYPVSEAKYHVLLHAIPKSSEVQRVVLCLLVEAVPTR